MEQEVAQVIQAITIASDPSQISLHQQALEFLSNVSQNAAATWRLALAIFVETNADGTTRKHPAQARFWALRVLDEFFDNRCVHIL
jgi:exportin-T